MMEATIMLINRLMVSKTNMILQIFTKNRSTLMHVLKQEALKSKKIIVVMVSLLNQKLIMPKKQQEGNRDDDYDACPQAESY